MEGYCIKCKTKKEVLNGVISYYKNGTPVEKGVCATCGSKISRILSKAERDALKAKQVNGEVTNS